MPPPSQTRKVEALRNQGFAFWATRNSHAEPAEQSGAQPENLYSLGLQRHSPAKLLEPPPVLW